MRRNPLVALALSLAATLGLFLAGELTVRLLHIEPAEWPTYTNNAGFRGIRVDPVLGWLLRPGWRGGWLIGGFPVEADERGFRATGYPAPPAPARRLAFVGDSCSFGWGVGTPDTFVARLDAMQRAAGDPPTDMMNAAFPGQSAVVGVQVLRQRVLPLHPDVVVIGFSAHNAFVFALASDTQRFRFASLRTWVLRSRLLHIAAAWWANRSPPAVNPRQRRAVLQQPLRDLRRVADAGEFEGALRTMVEETRASGATPVFLLLPRASMVTSDSHNEDSAALAGALPAQRPGDTVTPDELHALETSCLDHRALRDPVGTLYEQRAAWRSVYPYDPAVRALLREGAQAFIDGDAARAADRFAAATALQPDSPLAHYDLGVSRLARGDRSGWDGLAEADRLACSAFLHYNVTVRKVALDLGVPVVDISLYFQAHDGEALFLDPAHPNPAGHEIIARALYAALDPVAPRRVH